MNDRIKEAVKARNEFENDKKVYKKMLLDTGKSIIHVPVHYMYNRIKMDFELAYGVGVATWNIGAVLGNTIVMTGNYIYVRQLEKAAEICEEIENEERYSMVKANYEVA